MNMSDIKPNMRVFYAVPQTADRCQPDVERGIVSSINKEYVFVRFDSELKKFGWEGTASRACRPADLYIEPVLENCHD